jgi:hypothetical protein
MTRNNSRLSAMRCGQEPYRITYFCFVARLLRRTSFNGCIESVISHREVRRTRFSRLRRRSLVYGYCVVGGGVGTHEDYCAPCGVCRQIMAEFCVRVIFDYPCEISRQIVKTLEEFCDVWSESYILVDIPILSIADIYRNCRYIHSNIVRRN